MPRQWRLPCPIAGFPARRLCTWSRYLAPKPLPRHRHAGIIGLFGSCVERSRLAFGWWWIGGSLVGVECLAARGTMSIEVRDERSELDCWLRIFDRLAHVR